MVKRWVNLTVELAIILIQNGKRNLRMEKKLLMTIGVFVFTIMLSKYELKLFIYVNNLLKIGNAPLLN